MKIIVSLFMMNKIFLSFKDRIGRVFSPDKKKKRGTAGERAQEYQVKGMK